MKFKKKTNPNLELLDQTIDTITIRLDELDPTTDEYAKASTQLLKLIEKREELTPKFHIKPEVWVTSLTSLVTVVLITHHEQVNVITTKALGFVVKPKI